MNKTIAIEERMLGHVESVVERESGKYTNYFLNVRTLNGILVLKYWDMRNKESFPKEGAFVEVRMIDFPAAVKELASFGNLSLDSIFGKKHNCVLVPINEEDVPEDVKGRIKRDRTVQRAVAKEALADSSLWKDKAVHDFLLSFVKEHSEKFVTVPAALGHHHAYRGGLFIHSSEVFHNCVGLASSPMNKFYDPLDTDALYLAAWLHDAGKMEVYYMDGDSPKMDSQKENMIGHPTISDRMFLRAAEGRGFSDSFMNTVSHCILSHHCRPKWGAVVPPSTKEAHILCQADYLSSRNKD